MNKLDTEEVISKQEIDKFEQELKLFKLQTFLGNKFRSSLVPVHA